MVHKATFEKFNFDYPNNTCFYCQGKPTGILTFIKTGEEIRTCESCARRYGKIRRFKKSMDKPLLTGKEAKINLNSHIKNPKNEILKQGVKKESPSSVLNEQS